MKSIQLLLYLCCLLPQAAALQEYSRSAPEEAKFRYFLDTIHRLIEDSGAAEYFMFVGNDEISKASVRTRLRNHMDPCGEAEMEIPLKETPIGADNEELMALLDKNTYAYVQKKLANLSTSSTAEDAPMFKISIFEEKCSCRSHCNETFFYYRSPTCYCDGHPDEAQFHICEFDQEEDDPCGWNWLKPNATVNDNQFSVRYLEEHDNYHLSAKLSVGSTKPAIAYSPYYEQSTFTCMMKMRYNVHSGSAQAALRVVLETEDDGAAVEREIFHINNHHKREFSNLTLPIGHIRNRFRVRIECSGASGTVFAPTKCSLDDIQFLNCEDFMFTNETLCPHVSDAVCSTAHHSRCISHSDVCDLSNDCFDASDEGVCGTQPPAARMTFDDGYYPWTLSSDVAQQYLLEVADPAKVERYVKELSSRHNRTITAGPLVESRRGGGGFVMYSIATTNLIQAQVTRLTSPIFGPTAWESHNPFSKENATCTVRFRYCATKSAPGIAFTIEYPDVARDPLQLWEAGADDENDIFRRSKCFWSEKVIPIPKQRFRWMLRLSAYRRRQDDFDSYVAVDDITISPTCFPKIPLPDLTQRKLEDVYEIDTCNRSFHLPPSYQKSCPFRDEISLSSDGIQRIDIPRTASYLMHVCGAAGGYQGFASDANTSGACVLMTVNLKAGDYLDMIVGQMGHSPCTLLKPGMMKPMFDMICNKTHTVNIKENHMIGGTGGGATVVYVSSNSIPIVVAAGGGGAFPLPYATGNVSSMGSGFVNDTSKISDQLKSTIGCLFCARGKVPNFAKRLDRTHHVCQNDSIRFTNGVPGGFGGGGDVCEGEAGSGGGYYELKPTVGGNGRGGISYVDKNTTEVRVVPGSNNGNGFIRIYPCTLSCPTNSTCHFRKAELYAEMYCLCMIGVEVSLKGVCPNVLPNNVQLYLLVIVFAFGVFAVLTLLGAQRVGLIRIQNPTSKSSYLNKLRNIIFIPDQVVDHMKNIPQVKQEHLQITDDFLGKGAFGEVFRGIFTKDGKRVEVAVKKFSALRSSLAHDFIFEAMVLNYVSGDYVHENILKLYGICCQEDVAMLVMELMPGGDLLSFMREARGCPEYQDPYNLTSDVPIKFMKEIAAGCGALHAINIIHRDLAARNCLLSTKGRERTVKICDFGFARQIYQDDAYVIGQQAKLPIRWMPFESFGDGVYSPKSDAWSFGIVCWEVFTFGLVPYPGKSNGEVMDFVARGGRLNHHKNIPNEVYAIMKHCFNVDPKKRPSFTDLEDGLRELYQKCKPEPFLYQSAASMVSSPLETPGSSIYEGFGGFCSDFSAGTPQSNLTNSTILSAFSAASPPPYDTFELTPFVRDRDSERNDREDVQLHSLIFSRYYETIQSNIAALESARGESARSVTPFNYEMARHRYYPNDDSEADNLITSPMYSRIERPVHLGI